MATGAFEGVFGIVVVDIVFLRRVVSSGERLLEEVLRYESDVDTNVS